MRPRIGLLAVAAILPHAASGQSTEERPGFLDVAWPGAALGSVGFVIGGVAGAHLADCEFDADGFCGLQGALFGAAALGTFGLATGVHLGNDRRGGYGLDLLTAAGIWGVSMALLAATGWDDGATTVGFVALPIAQLLGTVAVERATGDRRVRESNTTGRLDVRFGPTPAGGVAIAGRLRL